MVEQVFNLVKLIPQKGDIHPVLSPRQIITGIPLQLPPMTMGQYIQGHIDGTNNMDQEQPVCALYIGMADNDIGHNLFKLNTEDTISINRITEIPMMRDFIKNINKMSITRGN